MRPQLECKRNLETFVRASLSEITATSIATCPEDVVVCLRPVRHPDLAILSLKVTIGYRTYSGRT